MSKPAPPPPKKEEKKEQPKAEGGAKDEKMQPESKPAEPTNPAGQA